MAYLIDTDRRVEYRYHGSFADIKTKMYAQAIRIEDMDLFIAATAIYNDLTLVTNNTKHFKNIPLLELENWKT